MADTSAPVVSASPKKAAAKKPSKPRTAPSHPPVADMVTSAIKALKDRKGSSLPAIKKQMSATHQVDAQKLAPHIKKFIRNAVTSGKLVQTKGTGASGSFKLGTSGKSEPKKKPAKKPVAKKAAKKSPVKAKKPAAPKAKKSPAKAKKPVAAKKPAAKKSPAKAKLVKPKTAAAKKSPAKAKAPAKKVAAKKPAAKKPAAKKTPKAPAKK